MRTTFRTNSEAGAVILTTTICTFALLSFLVVGYLWMMMQQGKATERSQHWNAALAVAEAGVDEGMAHINWGFGTNLVNLATNGWTLNTEANCYGPTVRSLSNDVGGSYSVIISNTAPPVVISTATVSDKMNPILIRRAVEVTTTPVFAFIDGLTTITNSNFKGLNVGITSSVASVYGSVNLGNGTIAGNVFTGPDGQVNVSPSGHGSYTSFTNNFFESFPDVQPPYSFGTTPPTVAGDIRLAGGTKYYVNGNYSVSGSLIITGTNAVLYVTGNFSAYSISNEPGASLTLYVGSDDLNASTTATLGQNQGDKINGSGTPDQFSYFGLPNNTGVVFKNGLDVVNGSFYAPEANFDQHGNMSLYGALLGYSYTGRGNTAFTWDPNLAKTGPVVGYAVASWKEIPPP